MLMVKYEAEWQSEWQTELAKFLISKKNERNLTFAKTE